MNLKIENGGKERERWFNIGEKVYWFRMKEANHETSSPTLLNIKDWLSVLGGEVRTVIEDRSLFSQATTSLPEAIQVFIGDDTLGLFLLLILLPLFLIFLSCTFFFSFVASFFFFTSLPLRESSSHGWRLSCYLWESNRFRTRNNDFVIISKKLVFYKRFFLILFTKDETRFREGYLNVRLRLIS